MGTCECDDDALGDHFEVWTFDIGNALFGFGAGAHRCDIGIEGWGERQLNATELGD